MVNKMLFLLADLNGRFEMQHTTHTSDSIAQRAAKATTETHILQ